MMSQAALDATQDDIRDNLFSLRLAAAVAFDDGTVVTAHQTKALEYGSTINPITKLAFPIEEKLKKGSLPVRIVMVDQFGVLHSPFAQSRAYFYEGGASCGHMHQRAAPHPFSKVSFVIF